MKKIISSILIAIVILQIFAPFSVGFENKKVGIVKNEVRAEQAPKGKDDKAGVQLYAKFEKSDTTITVYAIAVYEKEGLGSTNEKVVAFIENERGEIILNKKDAGVIFKSGIKKYDLDDPLVKNFVPLFKADHPNKEFNGIYKIVFKELKPSKTYTIGILASQDFYSLTTFIQNYERTILTIGTLGVIQYWNDNSDSWIDLEGPTENKTPTATLEITTSKAGETENVSAGSVSTLNDEAMLPTCQWNESSTWGGCVGRLLYWAIFKPTSYIFGLTGKMLDISVDYSIKDTSYRSGFVVEGWGIVRDFCNMFFIFILLYVAIGTILNLHSVKTKEMIINVVIIGLLMNFSLFATQVMVDASNILTRVFSNSITVGVKGDDGKIKDEKGSQGEIKLSEALVSKINPQKLILEAYKADDIKTRSSIDANEEKQSNGITATTFILVTLLASIVNIVGLIVFVSCSLIFITRVIGLWLAMILVPIAFFSYTVPALSSIKTVGWTHWWPDTLKLAFLAPVFMFFMYIIIMFLDTGLNLFGNDDRTGMDFVLGIFIPFIFIMALLWKAKSIANDMSGEIGQSITKGLSAVGGMALGGAALGIAALGRGTLGAVSKSVQNDGARNKDLKTFGDYKNWSTGKKLNPFAYLGQAKKTAVAGIASGIHIIPAGEDKSGNKITLGEKWQNADKDFNKKNSSQGTLDSYTEKAGFKDRKWKDLSEPEQMDVRKKIDKDKLALQQTGTDLAGVKDDAQRKVINDRIETAYKDYEKADKSDLVKRKTAETKLVADTTITGDKDSSELIKNLSIGGPMGEFVQALRKGSYDLRNISKLESKSKGFPKAAVGTMALIASGVRMGLKDGIGIEHGTGQKDIMKDLGNTITEALKGVKINISTGGGGGGGHKSADAHGGGGHH